MISAPSRTLKMEIWGGSNNSTVIDLSNTNDHSEKTCTKITRPSGRRQTLVVYGALPYPMSGNVKMTITASGLNLLNPSDCTKFQDTMVLEITPDGMPSRTNCSPFCGQLVRCTLVKSTYKSHSFECHCWGPECRYVAFILGQDGPPIVEICKVEVVYQ